MKSFITFAAGDQYEKLSEVLKESIELNSKYDLIIYKPDDFNIEYKPESWEPGYIFIYKVLSCLKALETYDELVWLDNDCLVTKNIDKIWERKIDNYPLLPNERFNNFHKLSSNSFKITEKIAMEIS
jgi:alpha-N-acetylglucosamine transferase